MKIRAAWRFACVLTCWLARWGLRLPTLLTSRVYLDSSTTWILDDPEGMGPMPMLPIKYLTIHCAATPEGRDVSFEAIEQWDVQKFGQKSYHWIVDIHGRKHRSLLDDQKGAHVGGHNTGNIGICYIGGMDSAMKKPKDTRNQLQNQALRDLVAMYKRIYPGILVRGHRDWPGVKKACPSFDVASWLKAEGL